MDHLDKKEKLDKIFILHSDNYLEVTWSFGKAIYVNLFNFKEVIDSLPEKSTVFALMDCYEIGGCIGLTG